MSAGQPRAAIDHYTRAVVENPRSLEAHLGRADAFIALVDRPRAIADLDTALRLASDRHDIRLRRARLLFQQRCYDTAIADYDVILQQDGDHREARIGRANCRVAHGQSELALADIDHLLGRVSPGDGTLLGIIGHVIVGLCQINDE
jgi:tetratricopeptide (TPR) repeat protein